MNTIDEPLLTSGMAAQRRRRAELRALSPPDRRRRLQSEMIALARELRLSHPGYASLYRAYAEPTPDTLPALDKKTLTEQGETFLKAADVDPETARRFLDRPFRLGSRLDSERVLFTSSGSTGRRLFVPYHLTDLGRSLDAFHTHAIASAAGRARRMLYIGLLDRHNGGNAWMHYLGSVMQVRLVHLFEDVETMLREVAGFRPDVILTRPHVLTALGVEARRVGLRLPESHLLSVGDPLSPEAAREIERTWGRPPHNSYSTVETGPLGYQEDPLVPALTIYDDLSLIEVLTPDGRPVTTPDTPGRIAVTTLYRSRFPLIRYLIGDVATWTDGTLTRLGFPAGRSGVRLTVTAGRADPVTIAETDLNWPSPAWVREYQVEQTGRGSLLARYTLSDGCPSEEATAVPGRLAGLLRRMLTDAGVPNSPALRVETCQVPRLIPDRATGKLKRLIPLPDDEKRR